MIAAEHSFLRITIFIVRRARGSKEYGTNPKGIACSKSTTEILEQGVEKAQLIFNFWVLLQTKNSKFRAKQDCNDRFSNCLSFIE